MSENQGTKNCKPILSIHIDEVEAHEGVKDYRVTARIHYGGLVLEFDKTVEEIRGFFTERRLKGEQRQLREGKNKLKTV
jgi:hypothetical protein